MQHKLLTTLKNLTTEHLTRTALKVSQAPEKVLFLCYNIINWNFFMINLRPHQQTIIDTLQENNKGQVIVPTGGGKTMCMVEDTKRQFKRPISKTIVVVAPRILLAQQLCEDFFRA